VLQIHGEIYLKQLTEGEKKDEQFWNWRDSKMTCYCGWEGEDHDGCTCLPKEDK
tara:strand:- start:89 stop:250 length:162 start_codon:yes stop_codon:yes gene_type:complete